MIIKLTSSNTNFSYVLDKNPESGLFIKGLRQGLCVGKFIDNNTYLNAFQEGVNENSFDKDDSNQLVYKGYCCPESALSILGTAFDCIKKDKNRELETEAYINTITIYCLEIGNLDVVKHFSTDYINLKVEVIEGCNLVNLTLFNQGSFIDLIRYTCLLLFMSTLKNDNYFTWDQVNLYATMISKCKFVPFLVRHRLRGMLEPNLSKKAVPLLNTDTIKLSNIGRNENQRFAFVGQHIKYRDSVLDIGCGPGKYIKVSKATKYIGVDVDEKCIDRAKGKAKYLNVEASFYSDWQEALETLTEPTTVLLIEFIEHVEKDEALNILGALIENINVKQILISTPNRDFNKYFNIPEGELRYDDHIYEMNEEEFNRLPGKNIKWGDSVDECTMTLYKDIDFENDDRI